MTDIERQELWVKLQGELADVLEAGALAYAIGDVPAQCSADKRENVIRLALSQLKNADSIRTLLAKIEAIGEP